MKNIIIFSIFLNILNLLNMNHCSQALELNIQSKKTDYTVGESIWLEVSLHNATDSVVNVAEYFMLPADDPNKNNIEIQVYDTTGNRISRISHVMTGRAFYYPKIHLLNPNDTYKDSIQIAGTFTQKTNRKKNTLALWCLGENPEITSVNEYPSIIIGTYKVKVIYNIEQKHLISLNEIESTSVWKGQLISNNIEISIK